MTTLSAQTSPAISWAEIHEEWREREQSALGVAVANVVGKDAHDGVHDLVFAERARGRGTVETTLDGAFAAASSTPGGMQLLALHVYGLCLAKWEKSEDYGRIRTVLDALGRVHDACSQGNAGDSPSAQLLSVLFSQAQLLDLAMGVEEAMNCSCPVAMGGRARTIVDELKVLDAILEALPASDKTMGADLGELRDVARADAAAGLDNFGNIVEVAAVVFQFAYPEVSGPPDFERVLTRLSEAERAAALDDDVYASELRAHRATLEALKTHADRPQLWIDAAEVVYVYPFTLRGISPEETVDRALRGRITNRLQRDKVRFRPAKAQNLELNDLWERVGRHEPGYSGACIALPKIRVETTAYEWLEGPDRDLAELWLDVEVRLSRLGNHYVRIRRTLKGAGLHDVNQALRRGSRAMGAEKVTFPGHHRTWDKVSDYASTVVEEVAKSVGAHPVVNPDATFHSVFGARSISANPPGGRGSPATVETLADDDLLGANLLFNPVRHLSTSLEEWIRYPAPEVKNVLGERAYTGDLVVRTDNTTVIFMPKSPEWLIDEYAEMVEFTASLPPLFTHWEREARVLDEKLEKRVKSDDVSVADLHGQELEILELEQDVRHQLAFLRSPELCRTRGQRQFLHALWSAAGLASLEDELDRKLTVLADRQERIAALIRRKQQEHHRRLERPVTFLVGFLTAASVAGVLQWVDARFGIEAQKWAILEAFILGAVALVFAVLLIRTRDR